MIDKSQRHDKIVTLESNLVLIGVVLINILKGYTKYDAQFSIRQCIVTLIWDQN